MGGAYSSSSRNATLRTSAASQVASGNVCARVTVVKSRRRTLMPIVRPRRSWRREAGAELLGHARELVAHALAIVDVGVEGPLARLRDDLARRADHAAVLEACATLKFRPRFAPKLCTSSCSGAAASSRERGQPELGEAPRGLRADARHELRRRAEAKRAHACSRVSTTNPAGFSASEATFATSLFGPIPTEQVSRVPAWISASSRRIAARGE